MADRQIEERSEDSPTDPAIGPSAALTTSSSAPEAVPGATPVTWSVVSTVQAVQEQFSRLVITRATARHVEFAERTSLGPGESRRVSIFGNRTQLGPSYTGQPSAGTLLASIVEPPAATAPTPRSVEKKTYEFTCCSECEPSSPEYEGCNHPEDLSSILTGPFGLILSTCNSLSQSLNSSGGSQVKPNMLRMGALSALFTDNLDEAVKGIFVSTLGGNIIAKDAVTSNSKVKRACALGALTWRVNCSLALGDDPAQIPRVPLLRTINTEVTSTNQLKSMIVDLEREMVAFEHVKEGLLVGVFGEKIEKKLETKVDDAKVDTGKAGTGEADEAGETDAVGDAGKANSNGNTDTTGKDTSTKNLRNRDEANESGGDTGNEGEPMWKDIKDKAEATAEYLRDELHNFRMPAGWEGLG
ncbi:hypothetical protein MMC18_000464 [Xylographa bjoerkii]|nr:hypothetical protein [Xylographa bjoerkii]